MTWQGFMEWVAVLILVGLIWYLFDLGQYVTGL